MRRPPIAQEIRAVLGLSLIHIFSDWLCPAAYCSSRTWSVFFHIPESGSTEAADREAPGETYEDSEYLKKNVYEILDYR